MIFYMTKCTTYFKNLILYPILIYIYPRFAEQVGFVKIFQISPVIYFPVEKKKIVLVLAGFVSRQFL